MRRKPDTGAEKWRPSWEESSEELDSQVGGQAAASVGPSGLGVHGAPAPAPCPAPAGRALRGLPLPLPALLCSALSAKALDCACVVLPAPLGSPNQHSREALSVPALLSAQFAPVEYASIRACLAALSGDSFLKKVQASRTAFATRKVGSSEGA